MVLQLWNYLLTVGLVILVVLCQSNPAQAAPDPYITRYLKVIEPVSLAVNHQGSTLQFSADDLSAGKVLFEQNCLNCHVGGSTLSEPDVTLSLSDLQGATPPRDTINGLVAFLREPMTYDGTEETIWCRKVPESWLPQSEIQKLAAFVLQAAQAAPGWGVGILPQE
jgi:photosystem II cytochrome c550